MVIAYSIESQEFYRQWSDHIFTFYIQPVRVIALNPDVFSTGRFVSFYQDSSQKSAAYFTPSVIFSYQYPDKFRSGHLDPIYLSNFEYEETCIEQTDGS